MLRVRDIMSKAVFSLEPQASLLEAAWALTRRNIGGAPVRDAQGNMIGMISKADMVDPEPGQWIQGEATVEDVMSPRVLSVYADDPAAAAAKVFADARVHRAVVYDADGGLAGIVTTMDVVRAVAGGLSFAVNAEIEANAESGD